MPHEQSKSSATRAFGGLRPRNGTADNFGDPLPSVDVGKEYRRILPRPPTLTTVQKTVLEAARTLFERQGYEATTVGDIVKLSGVSVGSIYHWFGGKADVFIATVEQVLGHHSLVSERAVRQARASGETRKYHLFVTGAKAFLFDSWEQRAINRVILSGDVPGEFNGFSHNVQVMLRRELMPLQFGHAPLPECNAFAVMGLLRAAALQLMEIEEFDLAQAAIDYFARILLRLDDDIPEASKPI